MLYGKFLGSADFLEAGTFTLVLRGTARCTVMDQLAREAEAELRVLGELENVSVAVGAVWLVSESISTGGDTEHVPVTHKRMRPYFIDNSGCSDLQASVFTNCPN